MVFLIPILMAVLYFPLRYFLGLEVALGAVPCHVLCLRLVLKILDDAVGKMHEQAGDLDKQIKD